MHRTWRLLAEGAQAFGHGAGGLAADAGVDLVEDEQPGAVAAALVGRDTGQREHDARQLAAGGDVAQRPVRDARVRGDAELDRLVAGGGPGLARA